jgi:hypothetical protein
MERLMGWRIRRSIRVGKGLRINLSKSGISTSTKLGPVTVNSRRGTTIRVAKGLSYHVDQGTRRAAPPALRASGSAQRHRSCLGTALKIIVIAIVVLVILGVIFG